MSVCLKYIYIKNIEHDDINHIFPKTRTPLIYMYIAEIGVFRIWWQNGTVFIILISAKTSLHISRIVWYLMRYKITFLWQNDNKMLYMYFWSCRCMCLFHRIRNISCSITFSSFFLDKCVCLKCVYMKIIIVY